MIRTSKKVTYIGNHFGGTDWCNTTAMVIFFHHSLSPKSTQLSFLLQWFISFDLTLRSTIQAYEKIVFDLRMKQFI